MSEKACRECTPRGKVLKPSAASLGFNDFSQVDMPGVWYEYVNLGVEKCFVSFVAENWSGKLKQNASHQVDEPKSTSQKVFATSFGKS